MIDRNNRTLTIQAENGETKQFDILFIFSQNPENADKEDPNRKEYVVFTDYSPDGNGGTSLSAASFHQDDEENLMPITKEEWQMVYDVLDQLKNK